MSSHTIEQNDTIAIFDTLSSNLISTEHHPFQNIATSARVCKAITWITIFLESLKISNIPQPTVPNRHDILAVQKPIPSHAQVKNPTWGSRCPSQRLSCDVLCLLASMGFDWAVFNGFYHYKMYLEVCAFVCCLVRVCCSSLIVRIACSHIQHPSGFTHFLPPERSSQQSL